MCKGAHNLDTLAQLRETAPTKGYSDAQKSFQKRARAKAISDAIIFPLIDLQGSLTPSYWSAYHCSRTILQQDDELKTQYCNQRFCLVCNRIRTAKLMNGYSSAIEQMRNPYFVTLTFRNVKGEDLKEAIKGMQKTFRRIINVMRYKDRPLIGLRKLEVTYNEKRNDFHPHFHCIIDGCFETFTLVSQWLKRYGERATMDGQDIRYANEFTSKELFKYFTKIVGKGEKYNPKAMDTVFRAMKGKRVFQPFGGIKKQSEDVNVKDQTNCDWKDPQHEIWYFEEAGGFTDWYNAQGESLSDVTLTNNTMSFIESIRNCTNYTP